MNARPALALIVLSSALLPLAACDARAQDSAAGATATATEAAPSDELTRSVRAVRAETGVLTVTRNASATVEPAQESEVSSAATGEVERILARSGSRVEAGQVVIQLDDDAAQLGLDNARLALETARINLQSAERTSGSALAQSDAALQAAQTGFDIAQTSLTEGERLLQAGGISQSEFNQLQASFEQARAALLQAQAAADTSRRAPEEDLELLRLAAEQAETQVEQAEQAVADAQLTAPYAGEVAEVLVEEGEFVGAGSPAFRLVSTEEQLARFSVAPQDAQRLLQGGRIWLPYNGLDYAAQVTQTSQTEGSRLVEVTATLYPSDTRIPNGSVTQFSYQLELARGVLVPSGALRQVGGQASVLAVREGRAEAVPVTVVAEGGAQVAVSGIRAGERVVFPLPADLTPGAPVEVIREGA